MPETCDTRDPAAPPQPVPSRRRARYRRPVPVTPALDRLVAAVDAALAGLPAHGVVSPEDQPRICEAVAPALAGVATGGAPRHVGGGPESTCCAAPRMTPRPGSGTAARVPSCLSPSSRWRPAAGGPRSSACPTRADEPASRPTRAWRAHLGRQL